MCTQGQIISAHIAREKKLEDDMMLNQMLGAYFARLDALRSRTHADEHAATAVILAARDGMIAAYQAELDLDIAYRAVEEMARSLLFIAAEKQKNATPNTD